MSSTRRLSTDDMKEYFTNPFNKHFLSNESTDVADVEVMGRTLATRSVPLVPHLIGITYDPREKSLGIALDGGDLRTYKPKEVWAIEEDDGFIRALEIARDDDATEIVRVRRLEVQRGLTTALLRA